MNKNRWVWLVGLLLASHAQAVELPRKQESTRSVGEGPLRPTGEGVVTPRADLPDTRPLTKEQARNLLEWDWLYQADNKPAVERSLQEVGWARELAERLARHPSRPELGGELAALAALEKQLSTMESSRADDDARRLYFAVREVKRRITFKNPLLDFNRFLVIERPYPPGQMHQSEVRLGTCAQDTVGRMVVVEGFDLTGPVRDLMPDREGVHWRADLSFDARKFLFSFKAKEEKAYHLYEMNVDGANPRQLTNHPKYDDIDPIYLPDGHVMFCTTRGNTYVRCLPRAICHVLARCDADGKNIYIISRNSDDDWLPALLNDGRVAYTRWEYTERPLWHIQKLWTLNPDGTSETHYWGNATAQPEVLAEVWPVPGSTRVMFTGTDHHGWWLGAIGMLDVSIGRDNAQGIWMITNMSARAVVGAVLSILAASVCSADLSPASQVLKETGVTARLAVVVGTSDGVLEAEATLPGGGEKEHLGVDGRSGHVAGEDTGTEGAEETLQPV